MQVLSIGLNHTTAPVEVRERAAVAAEHLDDALKDISKLNYIDEATILSTCNRTEVYCHVPDEQAEAAANWLCDFHELKRSEVEPYIYTRPNEEAVKHAFRVASGLDSLVIGCLLYTSDAADD